MSYEPNFNDPRIQRRARQALEFVETYVRKRACWISQSQLYKYFGNTSRDLGRWLVNELLTVIDPYWNYQTKKCKQYRRRREGCLRLRQLLGDASIGIKPEIIEQIETGDFHLEEKSDRHYCSAQYIPRDLRNPLLANKGYLYHYDIRAAAPTLLLQRARQIDPLCSLPNLEEYTKNRNQIRQQIARECQATTDQVKLAINALLQGSSLSTWRDSKLFNELDRNYMLVRRLQRNPLLINLRADIRKLWQILRCEFEVKYIETSKGLRTKRITSREKTAYYRYYENQVGKIIWRYLRRNSVRYLPLHDGWSSDQVVDPQDIRDLIRRKLGFVIELDMKIFQ